MNELYFTIGVSKQSFHQKLTRNLKYHSTSLLLLQIIRKIREDHPTMGVRDLYFKIQPENMGRDVFERFCKAEGLVKESSKNYRRTTDSSGVVRFDNLTLDLQLNRINQLWVSDITYYEVSNRFYYITFIEDAYSRMILGYNISARLFTEQTTLPAIKRAISNRNHSIPKGLIFHSDGGGQYYDKAFLNITNQYEMQNSMSEFAWENGKAERLNGIIKNNYLKHRRIANFSELVKEVDRSVYLYNHEKPHIKLQRKTPFEFENNYICNSKKSDDVPISDGIKKVTNPKGVTALRAVAKNPLMKPNRSGIKKKTLIN